jgi:4'-phosphopantetheinyl transferase
VDASPRDRPADDHVRVWLIPLAATDELAEAGMDLLDDDERRRADAFGHAAQRGGFVIAHAATRLILADLLDVEPAQIRWRHGRHGKPRLVGAGAGTHTSLSHSGGLAALAVASGRCVGVDLQHMSIGADPTGLSRRYFPDSEARYVAAARTSEERLSRFVRLWTRKEACVKVTGGRLMPGLRLSVRTRAEAAGGYVVRDPDGPLPGPYLVRDLPVPPGYRAAVAVEGSGWYTVSRRRWVTPTRSKARRSRAAER